MLGLATQGTSGTLAAHRPGENIFTESKSAILISHLFSDGHSQQKTSSHWQVTCLQIRMLLADKQKTNGNHKYEQCLIWYQELKTNNHLLGRNVGFHCHGDTSLLTRDSSPCDGHWALGHSPTEHDSQSLPGCKDHQLTSLLSSSQL